MALKTAIASFDSFPTMFFSGTLNRPIATPCIGVCNLGDDGLCQGCLRNGEEIARWSGMNTLEREKIMVEVLPQRQANRSN